MSDIFLLESKTAKLTKDRFVYGAGDRTQTYQISDIRRASMRSGSLSLPKLQLEFNDGTAKEFFVGTTSGSSRFSAFMSGGMVDPVSQDQKNSTQQWVTTINMLIAMR